MDFDEKNIVQLISSMHRVKTSRDFTHRVMSKVLKEESSFLYRIVRLHMKSGFLHGHAGFMERPTTKEDCAFCYGMTGSFFLFLGIVLMFGLKAMGADVNINHGIQMLPWFSFFAAIWLIVLSFFIVAGGRAALSVARVGTALFIAAVLGFLLPFVQTSWSPSTYMTSIMSLTALFMGILLYYQIVIFLKEVPQ